MEYDHFTILISLGSRYHNIRLKYYSVEFIRAFLPESFFTTSGANMYSQKVFILALLCVVACNGQRNVFGSCPAVEPMEELDLTKVI